MFQILNGEFLSRNKIRDHTRDPYVHCYGSLYEANLDSSLCIIYVYTRFRVSETCVCLYHVYRCMYTCIIESEIRVRAPEPKP